MRYKKRRWKPRLYHVGIKLSADKKSATIYMADRPGIMPNVDEYVGTMLTTKSNMNEVLWKWWDHQVNRNPVMYQRVKSVTLYRGRL